MLLANADYHVATRSNAAIVPQLPQECFHISRTLPGISIARAQYEPSAVAAVAKLAKITPP